MKKKLFFDLDGTLTDSGKGIMNGIKYAQNKLNLPELTPDTLHSCVGPSLPGYFTEIWNIDEAKAKEVLSVYREYYIPKGLYENELYGGIPELLKKFNNAGLECYVCSAKPEKLVHTVLNYFNISAYFIDYFGAPMDGNYKGKGAVLKEVLKKEKCSALMIGDRKNDISGGHEAGIKTVGVLWGYGSKEELTAAGSDFLADTPDEIFEIATNFLI